MVEPWVVKGGGETLNTERGRERKSERKREEERGIRKLRGGYPTMITSQDSAHVKIIRTVSSV